MEIKNRNLLVGVLCVGFFILSNIQSQLLNTLSYLSSYNVTTSFTGWGNTCLRTYSCGFWTSTIAVGFLAVGHAPNRLLGFGAAGSSLVNLLMPVTMGVNNGVAATIICLFKGLFEGALLPSLIAIIGRWAPTPQITSFAALVLFGNALGGGSSSFIFDRLISYNGQWEISFYLFGALGVVWALLFLTFSSSEPRVNTENDPDYDVEISVRRIPWKRIIFCKASLAYMVIPMCLSFNILSVIGSVLPILFMSDKSVIEETMYASFASAALILICGYISDYLRSSSKMSTTNVRKLFTILATLSSALFIGLVGLVTHTSMHSFILCLSLLIVLQAFLNLMSVIIPLDLAPRISSAVYGVLSGIAGVVIFIVTFITVFVSVLSTVKAGSSVAEILVGGMQGVFYVGIALNLIGAVLFGALGSGEKQDWVDVLVSNTNVRMVPQWSQ